MLLSTLLPAVILVAFLYLAVSRLCRWRWLSYGLALTTAGLLAATHRSISLSPVWKWLGLAAW